MKPLLELESVSYAYHSLSGETPALNNISFDVKEGEFIAIVGPSGCGKSTLLSLIAGLISPELGDIKINGTNVSNARASIGYMLQRDHLFEWRSIYKNVILGLEIQKKLTQEYLDSVNEMLINYGLEAFKDKRPSELSGGMRQRAALIRTLALKPSILLLDEPFSALDYQTRLTVSDDIGCIIKKEKKTAILVTHDLSEAISLGDKVIVLSKRPATIKSIFPIEFALENKTPLACRNAPEFKDYFNAIWKELNDYE
ncbi:ABC transporter ATP-binding protein [Candidatus Galacturonibacter soehngenii]|uniref:ABC transporter ATP-binding protein n=1 Tax=Candidatus Galacturonatibacter soehngenii TaxID=2307010 RepID=A0A7V7QMW1_9FIRM|nr:ABC transporter ATP-binding protein [Candidatus Galacturonibacter soehngenii]KAB1439958.1 ABC transporter ATP-binding protein [Candidatus Galacturonibacter soehngenii]MBA4685798.1 ABC transporter ATP-binding protein [Candidatus Galacturonibacter soehngenii]